METIWNHQKRQETKCQYFSTFFSSNQLSLSLSLSPSQVKDRNVKCLLLLARFTMVSTFFFGCFTTMFLHFCRLNQHFSPFLLVKYQHFTEIVIGQSNSERFDNFNDAYSPLGCGDLRSLLWHRSQVVGHRWRRWVFVDVDMDMS